jgi:hypothetical protein
MIYHRQKSLVAVACQRWRRTNCMIRLLFTILILHIFNRIQDLIGFKKQESRVPSLVHHNISFEKETEKDRIAAPISYIQDLCYGALVAFHLQKVHLFVI